MWHQRLNFRHSSKSRASACKNTKTPEAARLSQFRERATRQAAADNASMLARAGRILPLWEKSERASRESSLCALRNCLPRQRRALKFNTIHPTASQCSERAAVYPREREREKEITFVTILLKKLPQRAREANLDQIAVDGAVRVEL
jgi:hypothetical protein